VCCGHVQLMSVSWTTFSAIGDLWKRLVPNHSTHLESSALRVAKASKVMMTVIVLYLAALWNEVDPLIRRRFMVTRDVYFHPTISSLLTPDLGVILHLNGRGWLKTNVSAGLAWAKVRNWPYKALRKLEHSWIFIVKGRDIKCCKHGRHSEEHHVFSE